MSMMFSCTALVGTNKVGKLVADTDGYYTVVLGALNFHNSKGDFYQLEGAKALFEKSSDFMRRVKSGNLRGEYGHPKFEPGMTRRDFFLRVVQIFEERVSHHISDVWLEEGVVKDKTGNPVVAIMGRVKPCGEKGHILAAQMENPKENVCFSIRSITKDHQINGKVIKVLDEIFAWDYVNEPGISVAEKYSCPALESYSNMELTRELALATRDLIDSQTAAHGISMESAQTAVSRIIRNMGWEKSQLSNLVLPPSARWGDR